MKKANGNTLARVARLPKRKDLKRRKGTEMNVLHKSDCTYASINAYPSDQQPIYLYRRLKAHFRF